MRTITNHHWRDFRYREEVPQAILEDQFDWMKEDGEWPENDYYDGFFKYRGRWYHLSEFMHTLHLAPEWHGYAGDSLFSGLAIKISDDGEQYQVALLLS